MRYPHGVSHRRLSPGSGDVLPTSGGRTGTARCPAFGAPRRAARTPGALPPCPLARGFSDIPAAPPYSPPGAGAGRGRRSRSTLAFPAPTMTITPGAPVCHGGGRALAASTPTTSDRHGPAAGGRTPGPTARRANRAGWLSRRSLSRRRLGRAGCVRRGRGPRAAPRARSGPALQGPMRCAPRRWCASSPPPPMRRGGPRGRSG